MKAAITIAALALISASPGYAGEGSGADVVKAKGCLNCHEMDKKKVGPSFKDIAAKHDAKDASALAAKLKEGKGHTKISASDTEITTMVQYVLSQK